MENDTDTTMPITLTLRSVKGSRLTIAEMDGNLTSLRAAIEAIDWSSLTGKPLLFPPSLHTHTIDDVTGLQTALDGKQPAGAYLTGETDPVFQDSPAALIDLGDISAWNAAAGWGNHALAGYLTSSAIGVSVMAYSTNLSGWAALDPTAKQDALVSGTNIKTINGASVLGSGDLTVSAGAALAPWDEWSQQFFHNSTTPAGPFAALAISSGTSNNTGSVVASQDGYWIDGLQIQSSATANSGYRWVTDRGALMFGSKDHKFQMAWRPLTLSPSLIRGGFHDATTATAPVDGAWIDIVDGVVTGKTASNSVSSTTGTSYTLTASTAYLFDVVVDAAGTLATFSVLNGLTGAVLWTDTLTTNIPPKTTARSTAAGFVGTSSGTTAIALGILYMMGLGTPAGFARARG